jgi:DNA repair exonuclease SbcCD nuclease subunit
VEIVEEDPNRSINVVEEDDPQTPTMTTINVADAYDWQQRANNAEQKLSIVDIKLQREKRRTRRLQSQINEYIEVLARSTQDCSRMMDQCQLVSNTNLAISQELQKAKLMVETLEAVIVLLYTTSKDKDGRDGTAGSKGGVTVG